jgi:CBS-domain-containing membrane protein
MNTDVISVYPETDIETLLKLMREHELPGVPVIDHSNKVIGIVTEADLVIRDQDADLHLPHHIDLWGASSTSSRPSTSRSGCAGPSPPRSRT